MNRAVVVVLLTALGLAGNAVAADGATAIAAPWPAVVDQAFPDLELLRLDGTSVRMRSLAGKPLLIEYVGMTCAGCQAFLGGNRAGVGGFAGCTPQAGLGAMDEYLPQYAGGLAAGDARYTSVVVLLYGSSGAGAPSLADARAFADHFKLAAAANRVVLVGDARYIGPVGYAMIPGFHVVDAAFVLRSDATAAHAGNLWTETLPLLGRLASGSP